MMSEGQKTLTVSDCASQIEHLNMQVQALFAIFAGMIFRAPEDQRRAMHHLLDAGERNYRAILVNQPEMAESTQRTLRDVYDQYRALIDQAPR